MAPPYDAERGSHLWIRAVSQYKDAPIEEAVCEFRFSPEGLWDLTTPGLMYEKLREEFPTRQPVTDILQGVSLEMILPIERAAPATIKPADRIRFASLDGTTLIQLAPYVMSVHRLRPYPSWRGFRPTIMLALRAYLDVVGAHTAQSIGLRYINRIVVPSTSFDAGQYFEFRPHIASSLPSNHGSSFVGVEFPVEGDRSTLRLQLATAPSSGEDHVVFVLDLDYRTEGSRDASPHATAAWLDQAHEEISMFFEASITDRTRRLINGEGE